MLYRFSHLVVGSFVLLALLFVRAETLCAGETRDAAIGDYLSRLVPTEREIFDLFEREWRNARNLDELERAERFRSAMLGYLDRGFQDERVLSLIPRDLKSIYDSRDNLATRDLQTAYSSLIHKAQTDGRAEESQQLAEESRALTEFTPPFGLPDAAPSRYRVRPVSSAEDGTWQTVDLDSSEMNYHRSLSRISLGGESANGAESPPRTGLILLAAGESRSGYLAVEFSTLDDPGKYFFGIYERDRQVAEVSLPLEAGILYRWRFEIEPPNRMAEFELYDEQSRQQRLSLPWQSGYEIGFGTSVASRNNPARLMLIQLTPPFR